MTDECFAPDREERERLFARRALDDLWLDLARGTQDPAIVSSLERGPMPSLERLRAVEWCPEFERLMRNRLIVAAIRRGRRTGLVPDASVPDLLPGLLNKIRLYQETGNTEHLVDAANYCMLVFVNPRHPQAHFRSTDRDDSHHKEWNK